jgi:hypothetical protein
VNRKLQELAHGHGIPGSGSLLIGEKGTLFSPNDYGEQYRLLPEKDFAEYQKPAPSLPRSPGHKREWFAAIREGKPQMALSNFDYAGPFTETVLLGTIASRFPGRKLEWDGPNLKFTNASGDFDPNKYIKREYRKGWTL